METVGFVQVDVKANLEPLNRGLEEGKKTSQQYDKILSGSFKNAATASDDFSRTAVAGASKAAAANTNLNATTSALTTGYGRLLGAAKSFAVGAASAFAFGALISEARGFSKAMAEVSTLLPSVGDDMSIIGTKSRELANTYGTGAADQVKAYYQIISAGAADAASATELLDVANKLAVGGVTDIGTAADGLTSILNSYGLTAADATMVSDSLFVAMKAGKTTIGELADSLGKVTPFASQVGVSIDELTASIAALTKGGISTREATTGMRAVLAAIAKPTSEASKLAEELGLNFSAAGLKAEGFAGFLQQVVEKTGGTTENLSLLFGGVEALVPVMALAGQAGVDMASILEMMANKSGATAEAFDKVADSLDFRFGAAATKLLDVALSLGNVLLAVLVPAMEAVAFIAQGVMSVFDTLGISAETVAATIPYIATAMGVAFGPAVLASVKAVAAAVGVSLVGSFKALTAAMLANPAGLVIAGLVALIDYTIGWGNAINAVKQFFMGLYETAVNIVSKIGELLRSVGILDPSTGAVEVSLKGDKVAEQITDAHVEGGKAVADEIVGAHTKGADKASDAVTRGTEKASEAMGKGIAEAGKEAGGEMYEALAQGGKDAGKEAGREMVSAAQQGGSIMKAAGIEFTAESIRMIDRAAAAAGDFLTTGANLMIQAAKAQIEVTKAQADLFKAQAYEARANAEKARVEAKGLNSGGGGSSYGGGGGSSYGGGSGGGSGGYNFTAGMFNAFSDALGKNTYFKPLTQSFANAPTNPAVSGGAGSGGSVSTGNGVTSPTSAANNNQAPTNTGNPVDLTVVNVTDPEQMINVISSREGSKVLKNFVTANREEIQRILGVA